MEKLLRQTLTGGKFSDVPPLRSKMMGAIRGKGNKSTESRFCQALLDAGITGWKLHEKLPGNPDIIFPLYKTVIFLDGCFWHGCPDCGHIPETNRAYWKTKIERNAVRDTEKTFVLKEQGFFVIRFWEHELLRNMEGCMEKVEECLEENLFRLCE